MVITGASSGIGRAAAIKIAAAGGIPILVARSLDKLEAAKAEIESTGGTAYVYSADLSDMASIDDLVKKMLADHASIDMLVNNAGRSIRRAVMLSDRPLPRLRAHDPAQLLGHDQADPRRCCGT